LSASPAIPKETERIWFERVLRMAVERCQGYRQTDRHVCGAGRGGAAGRALKASAERVTEHSLTGIGYWQCVWRLD